MRLVLVKCELRPYHDRMTDLTIDELAAQTGTKTSTIRLYQHQGVLPGPEIRGRVGFYSPGHVARLDLIDRLQARGYTLAAIKDLVESWESGRGLESLLGLESAVAGTPGDEPLDLTPQEFVARFGDVEIDVTTMQRAIALGLVEVYPDRIHTPNASFLDLGSELVRLGLEPNAVLDAWEHVESVSKDLAQRFRAAFEASVWDPFVAKGMPASDLDAVTAKLDRMRQIGREIVATALKNAIDAETDSALGAEADRMTRPRKPDAS